jgi:SAM-dependent methyltransferase
MPAPPADVIDTPQPGIGVSHVPAGPLRVAGELFRGRTLYRALFHQELRGLRLDGRILDLGGKSASASYFSHIAGSADCEIVSTDLEAAPGVLALDVQKPFSLPDGTFDFVLAFNLFEHVFDYSGAPAEVARVLKRGGKFIMCVPFLNEFHADPHDYYRFTGPALIRIWQGAGLRCTLMRALGEGLLTFALTKTASLVLPKLLYKIIAPILYLLAMPIDRLVALRPKLDGLTMPARFPLGYYAVFENPL